MAWFGRLSAQARRAGVAGSHVSGERQSGEVPGVVAGNLLSGSARRPRPNPLPRNAMCAICVQFWISGPKCSIMPRLGRTYGEVSERLMVPLSKSGVAHKATVGSNPTLSAERCWSGRSGAPGERVAGFRPVGSNPTLSATLNRSHAGKTAPGEQQKV
jgi:hypothetical protein